MVNTQLKILRVFGLSAAQVSAVLRQARADGCPGLRLLERDGEFAVCVQVSAPNQAMAEQYCEKWAARLRAKFGDNLYAEGEQSLAQTTLDLLLQKRKLLVATDETTGRLVGALLQPLPHSEAVFDFGTESYHNAAVAGQITAPSALMKKFPGDVVQAAAGRALAALAATGADFAVVYMPATIGQCPFVLVGDKKGMAATAIAPELPDAAIGNQILDLLRRRLQGLRLNDSSISFRPGQDRQLLIVSEAGRSRGNTTRFSLRRRADAPRGGKISRSADTRPDFEPMLDFDNAAAEPTAEPAAEPIAPATTPGRRLTVPGHSAAPARDDAPTGTILFEDAAEDDFTTAAPANQNTATPDPLTLQTAGPAAAQAARRLRTGGPAATAPTAQHNTGHHISRGAPAPSILDDDVPDFTDGLDPETLAAAQAADEAAARTPDAEPDMADLQKLHTAANLLFDADADAADLDGAALPDPDALPTPRRASRASAAHNRSLEIIEKSERRRRRTLITALVVFLLAAAAAGFGLWWLFRNDLGTRPNAKNYGTAAYDTTAAAYLQNGTEKQPGVVAYLGWPGLDGAFVYAAGTQPEEVTAVKEGEEAPAITRFATANALGNATPGNTVLECTGPTYAGLAELETFKQNAGFTLYLGDTIYRFKAVAVYYYDPDDTETNGTAFDLYNTTDLSRYYDYLGFVASIQARSLFDTGVEIGDAARFLTITGPSDTDGVQLCITGRLIEEGEGEQLLTSAIAETADPLLTTAQYQAKGQPLPAVAQLLSASVERYAQASAAQLAKKNNAQSGDTAAESDALSDDIAALAQQTQSLLAGADELLAGLTDVAGSANAVETDINQGAEGGLPEQTVTVDQLAATTTAAPTAAPTETPTEAPTEVPAEGAQSTEATAEPTAEPTAPPAESGSESSGGSSSAEGETIDVTMNGSAQTMDLVQCLAMIAQNELGSNAPAEAYKAQCVAAHCWILSQGGYPSVLGQSPGSAALAAAQEVAHVLVTYNGQVCFTPYFASASTGTASAAEVWGNDRAWLQAVDSPYDQSISSNWNTNGTTSGSARFSRQTLQDRILAEMDIDLSGVDPNNWFKILSSNQYGWVAQMQIGPDDGAHDTCSGRWFRENLLARQSVDGRSLRSQCFTFYYDADLDCFIFDVYGYGHGCGMSQWGAIGYAQNGWSYQDILTHYFVGTTITTY